MELEEEGEGESLADWGAARQEKGRQGGGAAQWGGEERRVGQESGGKERGVEEERGVGEGSGGEAQKYTGRSEKSINQVIKIDAVVRKGALKGLSHPSPLR